MMKNVILSSDAEACVYSVPEAVADNLAAVCWDFSVNWLRTSPHAQKHRSVINGITVIHYDASDFIDYLNRWKYPEQPSRLIKRLRCMFYELPAEYAGLPQYNF